MGKYLNSMIYPDPRGLQNLVVCRGRPHLYRDGGKVSVYQPQGVLCFCSVSELPVFKE